MVVHGEFDVTCAMVRGSHYKKVWQDPHKEKAVMVYES